MAIDCRIPFRSLWHWDSPMTDWDFREPTCKWGRCIKRLPVRLKHIESCYSSLERLFLRSFLKVQRESIWKGHDANILSTFEGAVANPSPRKKSMAHGEAPLILEKRLLFLEGISCSFWLELSLRGSRKATNNTLKFEREVMMDFRAQTIWNCCSAIGRHFETLDVKVNLFMLPIWSAAMFITMDKYMILNISASVVFCIFWAEWSK